ncbi:hypothetical protein B0A48_18853 [Cryoendolithus antarcticus]|uniref:YTH domain-containing protein n=1 Tax=Cryoendolithus antarcticus TaxID=1507870 RepID=A0A1V8S7L1_9PEZI|nr:hypothetical protein B0A48_18853 [Cryoendolithus antarcticus]
MPGHQYQRLMMPNMQHPQMYLPPGYFHRYESAPMMHTEWRHSLEPRQAGSYTGTNSMSYNHSAHSAQQPSRGMIFTPRGPPRKPRQSGFALWVGNLPPSAGIADLKDHFSQDATKSIESFFLIAKSNCAFVNYRTEASCTAAMHRFHDSRFNGVRLVCRLRKGAIANSLVPPPESASPPALTHSESPDSELESPGTPTIVRGPPANPLAKVELAPAVTAPKRLRILASFFILKSLTSQDLDASVRRGEWTTQVHNEAALNAAFVCAENVYLIFSANKSGEYFGYARMISPISGDLAAARSPAVSDHLSPAEGPQIIHTPATATAPSGRIIDDSARGTIIWEAEDVIDDDGSEWKEQTSNDLSVKQDLGRPFEIEWISTNKLQFFRTRGMRNAWNANREVKIARDGTELEPAVGRRLLRLFHGVGS